MSDIDILYQKAVDEAAQKILNLSVEEFLLIGDNGADEVIINGKMVSIGWFHYKFENNVHHIFFKAMKKSLLIFYNCYLSGVKLSGNKIEPLTPEELGNYD